MIDVQHGALGPLEHHALFPWRIASFNSLAVSVTKGPDPVSAASAYSSYNLDRVERIRTEQRVSHRVLLVAGVFNVRF